MSNEFIQASSNYKSYNAYLSRLRYARVPLNNLSSTSVPIGLSSTTLLEFKIPSKTVINLAKSYITYQYTVPALAGNYGTVFEDNQDLCSWCYYGDGGGLGICDVNYVDRYTSVAMPYRTSQQEAMTRDYLNTCYTTYESNTTNVLPFSSDGLTTGTVNASTNPYLELQHLRFGGLNAPMLVSRQLPLSCFYDTFIGLDKNTIFGRDMYLRFNTQYGSRLGFFTSNVANPSANVTPFIASTCPQTLNNVYLYLAIEENKMLVDSLMSSLMAGSIKFEIPYTYVYRYGAASTASSSNMSITLTRQFGHKLKRLWYAPFCGNETSCWSFDHSNNNGTKITQLQSSIDSRPLTDYQLNCYNPNNAILPTNCGFTTAGTGVFSDDYREMRNKAIVKSCLTNYLTYQNFWSYMDSWGQEDFSKSLIQSDFDFSQIDDGLNLLDADHVYTIQLTTPCVGNAGSATAANGIVHYLFALFERSLRITVDGIAFE
jgi:hypothetical protein